MTGEIVRLGAALRSGELSAAELADGTLDRAEELQGTVGAFAELTPGSARRQAARADEELRAGLDRGPLHGLPVTVKDVIDVAGTTTRLGTPGAGHRTPTAHADPVEALTRAGAVVIGKVTTHELAFGMVTPGTRNPLDTGRIVGGSSGGSAASVAAGLAVGSLGTDTSGSVRCPAALCGVVGLKPTFGALPRGGVAPLAPSQDTVGILAPTAEDCAAVWGVLAGGEAEGATGAAGLRLGVDRELVARCSPGVGAAVSAALDGLAGGGAELVDVRIPHLGLAASASILIMLAEAAEAWGAELDRRPAGFGPVARAALAAGREVPARDVERARAAAALIRDDLDALLDGLDGLLLPTVPVTAARAGEATVDVGGRAVPVDAAHARFTSLASVTGHPAISVPCGSAEDGLPAGLQAIAARHQEALLLRLAGAVGALPSSDVMPYYLPTTSRGSAHGSRS